MNPREFTRHVRMNQTGARSAGGGWDFTLVASGDTSCRSRLKRRIAYRLSQTVGTMKRQNPGIIAVFGTIATNGHCVPAIYVEARSERK